MTVTFDDDSAVMRRALALATRGEGFVEQNPMVGAVIVDDEGRLLGEGFHERFGGPHAEINALAQAGPRAKNASLFVTLEPCCHHGKTPPCTRGVIEAGIRRVVVCVPDPSAKVAGRGIAELRAAGLRVDVGLCTEEGARLIAPFTTLNTIGRPFVIAKWAMTLDGKLATQTGDSQWISNPQSREIVHHLRGRVDAIAVGIGTVLGDDPRLTARPPGPRTALRVIVDSRARLPRDSQLARTAKDVPTLLATTTNANPANLEHLRASGVEVAILPAHKEKVDLLALLKELGNRSITNLLVEGGGELLGALFDLRTIDEVHTFIAPKLIGGAKGISPVLGDGRDSMAEAITFDSLETKIIDSDVYTRGRLRWN